MLDEDEATRRDLVSKMLSKSQRHCIYLILIIAVLGVLLSSLVKYFVLYAIFPVGGFIVIVIFAFRFCLLQKAKKVVKCGHITTGLSYYYDHFPGAGVDEWIFQDSEADSDVEFNFKTYKRYLGNSSSARNAGLPGLIVKHDEITVFWMFTNTIFGIRKLKTYGYYPQYENFKKLKITDKRDVAFIDGD